MRINLSEAKNVMMFYKDAEPDLWYENHPQEDPDLEELALKFPQDVEAITELHKIYHAKAIAKFLGVRLKNVGWETPWEWEVRNDDNWRKGNKRGLVFEGSVEEKRRQMDEASEKLSEIHNNLDQLISSLRELEGESDILGSLGLDPIEGVTVNIDPIVLPEDWEYSTSMVMNQIQNKIWDLDRQAKNLTEGE